MQTLRQSIGTTFHWVEEDATLAEIALLLLTGGCWVAFWNVFGDDSRPDPKDMLDGRSRPSAGERGIPFGCPVYASPAQSRL
jgi:hypothetical protein